jgi:hypothetical protein
MKKSTIVLFLSLAVAGGVLFVLSTPGGVSAFGVNLGASDKAFLRDRTVDFLEDIRFKDFTKASTYHLPATQKARDIPALIQRVFKIKHEILDIQRYEILDVDLDRGKSRARVRAMVYFHVLGDQSMREKEDAFRNVEMLFYWFKQPDGQWVMELESSLRT